MARVYVTRRLPGPALERLIGQHDVTVWEQRLPPPAGVLREWATRADGLITLLTDRIDEDLLSSSPRLRVVSNYAVGVDNVDLAAATARGIQIGHTPDVLTEATADLVFALMLATARQLPQAIANAREDWLTWEPEGMLGASVHGATLGIIGLGRIGQAVAKRAAGFDMRVLSTSAPHTSVAELHELLGECDFVTIHCPLTPATRHLFNGAAFAAMKQTAILINTARGPIVDPVALRSALVTSTIAGAALDVTEPEPLPPDHTLWQAPNLMVVPHIGSATRVAREQMTAIAVANLVAALDGERMPNLANPEVTPAR